MKRHLLLALFCGAFVFGCKKKTDYEAIDFGYNYFPNGLSTYIDYEVDSISYGTINDTTHFFLREKVAEEFVDNEGQLATRLERYKRPNLDADWTLTDVWFQKRTTTTAERVEENIRYVRLTFPIKPENNWDGNVYNTEDVWNYRYSNIAVPYEMNGQTFEKTLRVNQRNNINLIDQEDAWEVYAEGIGLIHKKLTDLTFQNQEIVGVSYEMRVIDYGTE